MDSKITLALFIAGFWLFLPFPMMWLGVYGFDTMDIPTNSNSITILANLPKIYFKAITFSIPDIPIIVKVFINFLQIASLILIYLLLREG